MSSILRAHSENASAVASLLEQLGMKASAAGDRGARARALTGALLAVPGVCSVGLVLQDGVNAWAGEGAAGAPPAGAQRLGCSLEVGGQSTGELALWFRPQDAEGLVGLVLRAAAPWMALVLEPARARGAYREELRARLEQAQRAWQLTERQREVLSHVVRGDANKEISATLRCAERTVEIHVTELLRKSGSSGRAMLAARFWSEL